MAKDKIDLQNEEVKEAISEAAKLQFEALYQERHDKEVEGLLNKNTELLGEKKSVKEKLDELSTKHDEILGKYDFENIDKQLEDAKKASEDAMTAEERFESQMTEAKESFLTEKADLLKERTTEKEEFESVLEKKTRALNKSLISGGLAEAISEEGGYSHLLTDMLSNQVKVVLDGDEYVARVMDGGEVRLNDDKSPMSIKELVRKYKEDKKYGVCFSSSGSNGGGASGNNAQAPSTKAGDLKRGEMSNGEKSKYISKNGMDKYLSLPE